MKYLVVHIKFEIADSNREHIKEGVKIGRFPNTEIEKDSEDWISPDETLLSSVV